MASLTAVVALHLSSHESKEKVPSLGLVYKRMEWSGNSTTESDRRFMLRYLNGDCGMREWDVDVGLCGKENQDNLSEWLRRQTRNLLGFARAGSNPAVVAFLLVFHVQYN